MEKLSIDAAFRFHEMEWKELEERGCKKEELSIWIGNGGMIDGIRVESRCFLCEYAKQQSLKTGRGSCRCCPAEVSRERDCYQNDSDWELWEEAAEKKDTAEAKRLAGIIRRWPRKIKEVEKIKEKVEVFYSRGQRFKHIETNEKYILASCSCGGGMSLINLVSGKRWSDRCRTLNTKKITEDEFKHIKGSGTFKLITEEIYQTSV